MSKNCRKKYQGRVQDFERGGPKRSSDFKRGGVQWSEGGGPVNLSHYDDKSCIFRC